jgi:ring-1,2-phenylacetyl-CoA epoxidase subunit PaaD
LVSTAPLVRSAALERAREVAAGVTDPELPMLTLDDLGILRDVELEDDGQVVVSITPTYSGCPAMATMRDDLVRRLQEAGFAQVSVKVSLHPAWTTDWISGRGKQTLSAHGISPPGAAPVRTALSLSPTRRTLRCPLCRSHDVALISEFGSTACKALYRCCACLEPFDHVKEI